MSEPELPIGQALRLLRARVGITQSEVPARGGPDHRTISHWETDRKQPSLKLLAQYLAALGYDFHDLQNAFDQLENRQGSLHRRLVDIELRLSALEIGERYRPEYAKDPHGLHESP